MPFVSETTKLIEQFKQDHPDTERLQREGRARLWDKEQNPELREQFQQSRINQKPYVYDVE